MYTYTRVHSRYKNRNSSSVAAFSAVVWERDQVVLDLTLWYMVCIRYRWLQKAQKNLRFTRGLEEREVGYLSDYETVNSSEIILL